MCLRHHYQTVLQLGELYKKVFAIPKCQCLSVCICVFVPLLVHECVIVKWQPSFCMGLKGGPVGGP